MLASKFLSARKASSDIDGSMFSISFIGSFQSERLTLEQIFELPKLLC